MPSVGTLDIARSMDVIDDPYNGVEPVLSTIRPTPRLLSGQAFEVTFEPVSVVN